MQTAVDCNGSNRKNDSSSSSRTAVISSSNTSVISTSNAIHSADNDGYSGTTDFCASAALPSNADKDTMTHAVKTSTPAAERHKLTSKTISSTAALPSSQTAEHHGCITAVTAENVLRQRLHLGKSTNNFNASAAVRHENGQTQLRFDAAEYLGSNVEQMSVTPSPSPNVSPSKKVKVSNEDGVSISQPNFVVSPAVSTSTSLSPQASSSSTSSSSSSPSSSSATNSNSNSTTSSVIATPILVRNGNSKIQTKAEAGDAPFDDAVHPSKTSFSLPLKSASFSTISDEHLKNVCLTNNLTSTSSSSTSSATPITLTPTSVGVKMSSKSEKVSKSEMGKTGTDGLEELLHWKDMPQYLQFNPYVLKGYRPLQTFRGCLFSLFYWHNETINILTHALPIVYILAIVPGLMPWEREYRFLSFCHVFGSVAPWCGSFIYHLFMNIEKGETCYYRLLKLDMVGIWVSQSFGALPLVTATTFCFTHKWKWLFIITYCLMSLWGLYKALTASSPWQRRLCFALPFTMRSLLTFLRTLGVVGGNAVALPHVYLQDVVSILGGAIGAMRIPEKWFPGLVDFYLNSHNIMHVLVVLAVYSMHKATIKDFEWMSTTTCNSFTNATNETLETTLSANIEL